MFENLQQTELGALLEAALRKQYRKGEPIFSQGPAIRKHRKNFPAEAR